MAALSPVSSRCVYACVAEVSVYGRHSQRKRNWKLILQNLITESEGDSIWPLQAGIFTENPISVKLHEKVGFRVMVHREKIGKLKDTWKDNFI